LNYQGAIILSKKEQRIYTIIQKYRDEVYTRLEAAMKLNLSTRQITRITNKIREFGMAGVKHGNCGKTSWNKVSEAFVAEYVDLYEKKYHKFNYSHALEMMAMHEDLEPISYTKFQIACRQRGVGKTKKRRRSKARVARDRHFEEGYMWQLDGSPDQWSGKETSSLIALIDDATSKVPGAELHPTETTWACMSVVRKAIAKFGRPEFILTDKAGWSEGSSRKRQHFSQFERACLSIDITVIATSSPESKGRVERLNRTFQDRLIPELDFFGITGRKDSNRYLKDVFIPQWDQKFTVVPYLPSNRYRPIEVHCDLNEVFCLHFKRIVNRDHTVSYGNKRYRILPSQGKTYKGKDVVIHEYEDKSISIFYGDKKLISEEIIANKRNWDKKGA